jgi:peptidoglycan/LPS O-acetylase OafA/YrhL
VDARRDLGNLGVRIFFVISGFLITKLLLEEYASHGNISLRHFFLRRVFRIFPPAYFYITVAALLTWQGVLGLRVSDLAHALTYTVNYDQVRQWHFMHLWSLSVEEQFYIIWPVVIWLAGARRASWVAACALALAPLARIGMWGFLPDLRWTIGTAFQTNADALAAGCVLAGIRPWLSKNQSYRSFLNSKWFLIVPMCVLGGASLLSWAESDWRISIVSMAAGMTVMNVGIAVFIDRCVRFNSDAVGRLLNARPMVFVGVLSYSLYLWQQPFLDRASNGIINWFPFNLMLTFAAALFSYYIIERPFLRLRKRMEKRLLARPTPVGIRPQTGEKPASVAAT